MFVISRKEQHKSRPLQDCKILMRGGCSMILGGFKRDPDWFSLFGIDMK